MALPTSLPKPPRYVENTSASPAGLSFVTKASVPPARAAWKPPAPGKFGEVVEPVTYALPPASTATADASSSPEPPRYVRYATTPVVSSFATKPSVPPPNCVCSVPITGRSSEVVEPTIQTLPAPSAAMADPVSSALPPTNAQ